jgi:hypothetical protein
LCDGSILFGEPLSQPQDDTTTSEPNVSTTLPQGGRQKGDLIDDGSQYVCLGCGHTYLNLDYYCLFVANVCHSQ